MKMVATTDQTTDQNARAIALCDSVKDLLEKGVRDAERVANALQSIKDGSPRFAVRGTPSRTKRVPFKNRLPHEQWERVYHIVCGKKVDCAGIALPPKPDYPCWPVIVVPEVPLNAAFAGLQSKFSCWSYYGDDLENAIDRKQEERDGRTEPHGIWVRAVRDAMEDINNCSANAIQSRGLKTVTLDERIRLEAFYWVLTGGAKRGTHLDLVGWTLCTGSRDSDGGVPCVYWYVGEMRVRWARRGFASQRLGARQVVTL